MKLSIIIPVYNVEDYILRSLNSACSYLGDLSDYEIIIVNDKTPDNSMRLVEKFVSDHDGYNFTLINNVENLSLGGARNVGIENAKGDYLMFLDSDDWIEPGSLEKIMKKIDSGVDLILLGVQDVLASGVINSAYNYFSVEKDDLMADFSSTAWSKIYRKDFFKEIRFPQYVYHEDTAIWPLIVLETERLNKIVKIDDIVVNYECRNQTSITKKFNQKAVDDYVKIYKFQDENLAKRDASFKSQLAVAVLQFKNLEHIESALRDNFKMDSSEIKLKTKVIHEFLKEKSPTMYSYAWHKNNSIRDLENNFSRKLYLPVRIVDKIKNFLKVN